VRGVRHSVGFDWNPETKQLYFTDNGRDWMSEDVPRRTQPRDQDREHFGAPYCLQGNIVDPEFGWGNHAAITRRRSACWPHAAALGMRFIPAACSRRPTRTRSHRPARLLEPVQKNWRRCHRSQAQQDGTMKSMERSSPASSKTTSISAGPVDIMQLKDGSILVSDDWNGAVYRVTYGKQKVAGQ